jgi:protein-tyrosine-phosphatase
VTFRVLFVCAANVCRSPTAAELFIGNLPENLSRTIIAESAGILAEPGSPWCAQAQRWVRRHQVQTGKSKSSEHRSRRLTVAKIARASLILAADTDVKSGVLRTDLQARGRLFTLIEAATLASGVEQALGDSRSGLASANGLQLEDVPRRLGEPRLEWLVAEMDAARGLVVPPGRSRLWRSVDVPDPHTGRRRSSHRVALRALSGAVTSLNTAMGSVNSS